MSFHHFPEPSVHIFGSEDGQTKGQEDWDVNREINLGVFVDGGGEQ